jgi:hypothetical protein
MRVLSGVFLVVGLASILTGCGRKFDGPTVDAFVGHLQQNGKPVTFAEGANVTLKVFLHGKGTSFGIPIQSDGSFKIGWMPIGQYSAVLMQDAKEAQRAPMRYNVPGGFTIEEGKTEYIIDLGEGYNP